MENWKPITGSDYEISDEGRVKSLKFGKVRILSSAFTAPGHEYVYLCADGKQKCHYVSTLVLEAFVSPRPLGFISFHLNGNTYNNNALNLRWVSRPENYWSGVGPESRIEQAKGDNPPNSFLTPKEVLEIREKNKQGMTYEELEIEYQAGTSTIARAIRGDSWKHV